MVRQGRRRDALYDRHRLKPEPSEYQATFRAWGGERLGIGWVGKTSNFTIFYETSEMRGRVLETMKMLYDSHMSVV